MLPGSPLSEAYRFVERTRDQVAERSGRTIGLELRLSAGAVQCPGYATDPATPLDADDEAMYRAKRRGKNRLFAALSLASAEPRRERPQGNKIARPASELLFRASDTDRSWDPNPGLETLLAFVYRSESILETHRGTGGRR